MVGKLAKLRTGRDGNNRAMSDSTAFFFPQPGDDGYDGRTQQSHGRECDINTIFAKYRVTGTVRANPRGVQPVYADIPSNWDLRHALDITNRSKVSFEALPSDTRKLFDNDYVKLYEFLNNPANLARSYELGLRVKPDAPVVPMPSPVPPVKDGATPPAVP